MALKLYLDDCSNSDLLAHLLRQAGHEVVRPTDEGVTLTGEDDDVQGWVTFSLLHAKSNYCSCTLLVLTILSYQLRE